MWSKTSETLIENSFSYVLRDQAAVYLWPDNLAINEEQYLETEVDSYSLSNYKPVRYFIYYFFCLRLH